MESKKFSNDVDEPDRWPGNLPTPPREGKMEMTLRERDKHSLVSFADRVINRIGWRPSMLNLSDHEIISRYDPTEMWINETPEIVAERMKKNAADNVWRAQNAAKIIQNYNENIFTPNDMHSRQLYTSPTYHGTRYVKKNDEKKNKEGKSQQKSSIGSGDLVKPAGRPNEYQEKIVFQGPKRVSITKHVNNGVATIKELPTRYSKQKGVTRPDQTSEYQQLHKVHTTFNRKPNAVYRHNGLNGPDEPVGNNFQTKFYGVIGPAKKLA